MRLNIIAERESRTYAFDYNNFKVDPHPYAVYFGSWIHPSTKNQLLCALNLNYLNTEQKQRLQTVLKQIFTGGQDLESGTRGRVRRFRSMAQDIFDIGYRTYDRKHVAGVTKGTIPHITLSPAGVEYEKEKAEEMGLLPPSEPGAPSTPAPAPAPAAPEAPAPAPEPPEPAPEPEKPEEPVEKKPAIGEPGAPPAPGFKPSSLQRRKLEGEQDKVEKPEPAALIQPSGKPTSVQRRKLGLGKAIDWLRRGAKKIGSAVRGLFRR